VLADRGREAQQQHKNKLLPPYPGFGQDSANFHQNPGRGTAGWADPAPIWPDRARYSIPCAVMPGSSGEGQHGGNSLAAREGSAAVQSERVVLFCWFVFV